MSLATILSEIWRLFRNRLATILVSALVIGIAAGGGRYFLGQYLYGDLQESSNHLHHVFNQVPASLRAIVTIEDGQVLSNPNLYDDYFSSPKVVEEVESRTGVNFSQTLQAEQALDLLKTSSYRGSIAGVRDQSSGIFTFRFLVGEDAEDNLAVAQAYQDILESGEILFAQNHVIEIVQDAQVGELLDLEVYDSVPTEGTIGPYQVASTRPIIVYGILGFVLGLILTLAGLFLFRLIQSKIVYGFEYTWDFEDTHILMHPQKNDSLTQLIHLPNYENSLALAQYPDQVGYQGVIKESLDQIPRETDQIVILVQSHQTDKVWYQEEYKLAKLTKKPLKIIHLIEGD